MKSAVAELVNIALDIEFKYKWLKLYFTRMFVRLSNDNKKQSWKNGILCLSSKGNYLLLTV